RLLLGLTPHVYRGPLADLLRSRCVLVLTTHGRRTGLPRTTAISFMPGEGNSIVVFAGFRGTRANWYLNLRKNPHHVERIGRRRFEGTATLVADPQRRRALMLQMSARSRGCGPPRAVRPVLKGLRLFDYEGEIALATAAGETLPVVEITPL